MPQSSTANSHHDIIVIGASLGGEAALTYLLKQLPESFSAMILVVLHMHPAAPKILDRILTAKTRKKIKFAEDEEALSPGTVYLAPPNQHLMVKEDYILLSNGPRENNVRPSIDVLFRSAAVNDTTRVIGVLLSGILDDGTAGLQAIKACGGITVVQNPDDAEYAEMPKNALNDVEIDHVVTLGQMGSLLMQLIAIPAPLPMPIPPNLQKEVDISQGIMQPELQENILGKLIPMACPECGGSISEIEMGKGLRYRCHEGHAYSRYSLLRAQNKKIEVSLWAAVRMLDEQAAMLGRIADRESTSNSNYNTRYKERQKELREQANTIRQFLRNKTPLYQTPSPYNDNIDKSKKELHKHINNIRNVINNL
jgi:two-component system, chemotaxis family, protein-glutamate methylesterase/glutaminase